MIGLASRYSQMWAPVTTDPYEQFTGVCEEEEEELADAEPPGTIKTKI